MEEQHKSKVQKLIHEVFGKIGIFENKGDRTTSDKYWKLKIISEIKIKLY